MAALGNPPDNARHLGNGGQRGGIARAPAREGPYPERKATRSPAKLHWYEVHTRETTSDHDPRRTGQRNLHTHVMSNENKSPIEKLER